jgi:parallel beta-helix repeat protein
MAKLGWLGAASVIFLCFNVGCSDDSGAERPSGTGGSGGTGGNGGSGPACSEAEAAGCDVSVAPSDDDTAALKSALIEQVQSNQTLCLCPGTYSITQQLSLAAVPGVTIKGLGATREDTVVDFAAQTEGDDGLKVTSDQFTIENLWVKNSPGNGVVVDGAEDVTFRNLKVSWDAGSVTENGAYAVYPVKSKRVIIEDTEVIGAADAGVYVGQCQDAIVRNNVVHGNVAGIEIENTINAEVYDNDAYDNTAGILVFVLPKLEQKSGVKALVRDNNVHDNNRANFAEAGTIVASVPAGTGLLLLAADEVEVRNNTIENNGSTGVLAVSMTTLEVLVGSKPDPETNPYSEGVYIHGNTFTNNGTQPDSLFEVYKLNPVEDIVWDGVIDPAATLQPLCLGNAPLPSFRNLNADDGGLLDPAKHTTDATPHECTITELPGVSW